MLCSGPHRCQRKTCKCNTVEEELDAKVFLCEIWSRLNNQIVDFPSNEKETLQFSISFWLWGKNKSTSGSNILQQELTRLLSTKTGSMGKVVFREQIN